MLRGSPQNDPADPPRGDDGRELRRVLREFATFDGLQRRGDGKKRVTDCDTDGMGAEIKACNALHRRQGRQKIGSIFQYHSATCARCPARSSKSSARVSSAKTSTALS